MRWGRRRWQDQPALETITTEDGWLDQPICVNGKNTTLRTIRKFAADMAEFDYRSPTERGLAMTIVALVDEVSRLHGQGADGRVP